MTTTSPLDLTFPQMGASFAQACIEAADDTLSPAARAQLSVWAATAEALAYWEEPSLPSGNLFTQRVWRALEHYAPTLPPPKVGHIPFGKFLKVTARFPHPDRPTTLTHINLSMYGLGEAFDAGMRDSGLLAQWAAEWYTEIMSRIEEKKPLPPDILTILSPFPTCLYCGTGYTKENISPGDTIICSACGMCHLAGKGELIPLTPTQLAKAPDEVKERFRREYGVELHVGAPSK